MQRIQAGLAARSWKAMARMTTRCASTIPRIWDQDHNLNAGRSVRISTSVARRLLSSDSSGFSHIDPTSNNPTMVNVSDKKVTHRTAQACSMMRMPKEIMSSIDAGGEIRSKKGPVFATAVIAGTMAAKRTHDLIPFCHPLGLESCKIHINVDGPSMIKIVCDVRVTGKTGVEMEALTGASVAALAVYDMCKGVSHDMEIVSTKLLTKTGGKSDIHSGVAAASSASDK